MRAKFVNEIINEELVGIFHDWQNEIIDVIKNPKSLNKFQPWVRGCSDSEGNLYVADSQEILHSDLVKFLTSKNIPDNFVDWQRHRNGDIMYLAEGYDLSGRGLQFELTPEEKKRISSFAPKAANMHPKIKFDWRKTVLDVSPDLYESYSQDQDPRNFSAWIDPNNNIYRIPVSTHTKFIVSKYPEIEDDASAIYDKAFLDGWVRVYSYHSPSLEHNELAINGKKKRTHDVFNKIYKQLSISNNYKIVFEYADNGDRTQEIFSTYDSIGKFKFKEFISNIIKLNR